MSVTTHYASVQAGDGNFSTGSSASIPNSHGGYCKVFFPCTEGSGNTLTDGIGDRVITDNVGASWIDDAKALKPADTALGDLLSGALALPTLSATKSWAIVALVKQHSNAIIPDKYYIQFGANAGPQYSITQSGAGVSMVKDGTTTYVEPADDTGLSQVQKAGLTVMNVTYKDASDNILRTRALGDYSFNQANADTTAVDAVNPIEEIYVTGVSIYGLAVFEFVDGFPDDWDTGLEWMRVQWLAGNKVLYPNWVVIQ